MIQVPVGLLEAAVVDIAIVADALGDVTEAPVDPAGLGSDAIRDAMDHLRSGSRVGRAALEQQVRTLQSFIDAALRLARDADATVVTGQSP